MEENKVQETTKKIHPKLRAGILSKIFFCWMIPTFVKGYKKPLTEKDLFGNMESHNSIYLGDKLENAWKNEVLNNRNPSFWRALRKVFWKEVIVTGVIFTINEFVVKIGQPICIAQLMAYYTPGQTHLTKNDAYMYAGLVVLLALIQNLIIHSLMLMLQHLGMKMRVAVCSIIYRKALRLSKLALLETTIGQMVNLLSNDVNRFDYSAIHIHHLWGAPIETIVVLYLLYTQLGIASITGVGFLLIFIPLQLYMGKRSAFYRLKTAIRTDERVRLMNEIINGIQVIKMYTWEKPFSKLVELARKSEISVIRKSSMLKALSLSFALFITRFAIYLCILTYVLLGNAPTHQFVFVCTSYYGILRQAVTMFLPQGVTQIAECHVSVKRIQKFLMYDEIKSLKGKNIANGLETYKKIEDKEKKTNGIDLTPILSSKTSGVCLQDVSARWVSTSKDTGLSGINFKLGSQQLVAIIGPVGSGKSTLLNVILKELPLESGTIEVNGTISYCSQEPWLFGGSIRQNILFGQQYNEKKYDEVIKVCALERDFTLFPYADRTIVGERGVMLSGGQRARINLARAIYKDADIYLLDDPLSAVDTHVGKQLFEDCITQYLKDKSVVLVTHQLQYLHNVDRIDLIEDGKIIISGSYDDLKNSGGDFTNLLNDHKEEEEQAPDEIQVKQDKEEKEDKKENTGKPTEVKEQIAIGKISSAVYVKYFRAGGGLFKAIMLVLLFVIAQIVGSGLDYFITYWVNLEQDRMKMNTLGTSTEYYPMFENLTKAREVIGSKRNYDFFTTNNCLYIYTALACSIVVFTISRSVAFYRFCMISSRKMHNNMFNNIVNASMSFFNNNASGRILNRFSKDMGTVDETLPSTMIDTLQIGLLVFAITLVVGSVNPFVLLPTLVILTIFYFMRIVFLASSRNIKRLEGTTRSPVFSHLSASLQGLTTIRAFGAEAILQEEFDKHQNLHSSAFYMFLGANRTFGFWLDLHCVLYIGLVTVSFLFIQNETYGGNVGLAITQSMGLCGMFQWGMRQWSELENQMTSIERILEYTELEPEKEGKVKEPPKNWPEYGSIVFESVNMRYSKEEPYVLKNLNFSVSSQEKVGIVGRTGAGKSSLISALFRLTDIEGKILIDNVNTKEISLNSLRSKISIIPQEPVLFSGTLRKNLDPFDEYNDDVLWDALEKVELKPVVMELTAGLDSKMSEGGTNFSVGQRQLVCLARAIIRKNKVLVMDEATANVDPQTDALIQSTIRTKFAECTVLTIAHRLHTIMDSDKVLVMDAGSVAEFGHPYELLQKNEVFAGLVKQTGDDMAASLAAIAEESYTSKKEN